MRSEGYRPRKALGGLVATALALMTAVATASPADAATRYEAESARISQGVVESNHADYSGSGFVNGDNAAGSYVEWTVQAASAGTATVALRYANGSAGNRPGDVSVNGAVVSAARAFGPTGAWSTWATSTLTVTLRAGANTIRVTATTAAGNPNLDHLDLETASSDTVPPTAPSGLTRSAVTATTATLSWTASSDDTGVTSYEVRSGGTVYATVTGSPPATSVTVTGLACASPYSLHVVARDAAGNVSAQSGTVTFTTAACGGGVPSGITQISTGWTVPWGVAWLPDGQNALVTERDSFRVYRTSLSGARTLVGTVPETMGTGGEGGLLGVAVDPNWASNRYVYFFHTASEGNRIARMTYDGTSLGGYTALVRNIPKNRYHNGGRLAFGPDGYLYATTGDAQVTANAQNRDSLAGKILRMTTAGQPAPGNPFGTLVYSYGHRNPQGIAWDSRGRLWQAEFGNSQFDELNLIKPGLNYGWPTCEGSCSVAGMENPKRQWPVSTASPSAVAVVGDAVYMAALRGERLWRIPLEAGEATGTPVAYYVGTYGRLRTVVAVPGADRLWLTTTNADAGGGEPAGSDRIFRVDIS
ncbi:PQQ-dependent sugar dehydrogenase [Streptosporangium sp. NPDC050855]|uniref:PQQ-dependent sugar dehydrogenase n=1 Tax=Streptosporangium sp. NPDC050855 TaxID=3366194 RepID=UPI0037A6CA47